MNNTITVYHQSTGKIWGVYSCPSSTNDAQCPENHSWIDGDYNSDLYFFDDGMKQRPTMQIITSASEITPNSADASIISGIPSGATIRWNNTEQIADGSDIEFVTDIIGEHKLQITLWPYQDAEVTINAI